MRQRDESTGQIVSSTVCGRRFCTKCGKWRHLLYFRPRRARNGREYPNSPCDGCHSRGNKRSQREIAGQRWIDRRAYERAYYRRHRRRRLAQIRRSKERAHFRAAWLDGKKAAAYFGQFYTREKVEGCVVRVYIHGKRALPEDLDKIKKLRIGQIKKLGHELADELCVRYDLPLWELEEAARLR